MPRYLLRAEAVNFAWSCYDTLDLSTIRGGSMLMVDAHTLIATPSVLKLEVHGASQAVWSFEAADEREADGVRRAVEKALTEHETLRHATFVVDVVPESGDDVADLAMLRACNHWRQLQQPTLAVPEPHVGGGHDTSSYCEYDRVRPGRSEGGGQTPSPRISQSVKARQEYGRKRKQKFYAETVSEIAHPGIAFANDLDEITSRPDCDPDDQRGRLHHKMAVIYCDGNKQGEMAARLNREQLGRFRDYARSCQQEFLKNLLAQITATSPAKEKSDDWYFYHAEKHKHVVRLETLLWGGDDIVLVVPAWKGWDVVRLFFEHVTGTGERDAWQFKEAAQPVFTYAVGLVFCNYKASVHRMRDLAEDLFVQGKKQSDQSRDEKKQSDQSRHENWLGYEVMESFDVAAADLDRWRASRLSSDAHTKDLLLLKPAHLKPVAGLVPTIRKLVKDPDSEISRRKIEHYARSMRLHSVNDSKFDSDVETYLDGTGFDTLKDLTTRQRLNHLAALWDYIA